MFEYLLGVRPESVSFHLFGDLGHIVPKVDSLCGMVNAYGPTIQEKYSYISDSNAVWRYRNLEDVLLAAEDPYLHVLTHPEWWTPNPMTPKEKVKRCAEGYSNYLINKQQELMDAYGRPYF